VAFSRIAAQSAVAVNFPAGEFAQGGFAQGDRFEVTPVPGRHDGVALALPPELSDPAVFPRIVIDSAGQSLVLEAGNSTDHLLLRNPLPNSDDEERSLWLEWVGPQRYRLVVERSADASGSTSSPCALAADIEFDAADAELIRRPAAWVTQEEFLLGLRAARLATHAGFDQLICLPMLREMDLLEHQTRTATTVLRRLRGRAMLCDEVGLGKTVEAGLILSELLMRGLARSVLVLTPPSLIAQWQGEMRRKFGVDLVSHDDDAFRAGNGWAGHDRVIASIHTAKREPHRSAILARQWDMVIVDEAHHLRNRSTAVWKFASELRKQFILLLTATPVQNNLEELFNLVTLLEPGLLSTRKDFSRRFISKSDKMSPTNVDELHALLGEVMVRNRRSTVGLAFTRRWARTEAVHLTASERALYDAVTAVVREGLRFRDEATGKNSTGINRMTLVMLQMAMGSSAPAAASMLANLLDKPSFAASRRAELRALAESAARSGDSAKTDRLLGLLEEFPDKLVVFTQFRATQEMLRRRLAEAGHELAVFHGGLSRMEKEAAIEQFRNSARVLLCTESGSEGRNLQFAHGLCNFDLPWSPMKIEQRIGRLSRIGQQCDVHVFNLVAAGTVEAGVLHLLEAKLGMFELVIGEVDMILGNLDDEKEFEDVIADEWAHSTGPDEFAARMEVLGARILAAKAAYFRQRTQDEKLFGNRFTPEG
jgi:SNF2 family DNA or RNA helicase